MKTRFIKERMEKRTREKKKEREKMGMRERGSLVVGSLLGERRKRRWEKNEKESAIPLHERECFKTIYCDFSGLR